MNKLNSFSMVASKVLEILMWVALGAVVLGIIGSCIGVHFLNDAIRENKIDTAALLNEANAVTAGEPELEGLFTKENYDLAVRALKMGDILRDDGTVRLSFILFALVNGIFHCAAFALVFRNVHLILKTAKGKTWFAQGETPFQADITRMIREIGIFLLGLAGVDLIFSFFSEITMNPVYIVIGILMLCLSSFFHYGEGLQKDCDGLI